MDHICCVLQCPNDVKFKCYCNESASYMCKDHSSDHCQNIGNHKLLSICVQLDEVIKKKYMQKCCEKRNILNGIKLKLIAETKDLLNVIVQYKMNALKKLLVEEEKLFDTLEMAQQRGEIYTDDYTNYLNQEEFECSIDFSCFNTQELDQAIFKYYSQNFLSAIKLIPVRERSNLTKSMIFFLRKSKTLIDINIQSMNMRKFDAPIENNMGSHAG